MVSVFSCCIKVKKLKRIIVRHSSYWIVAVVLPGFLFGQEASDLALQNHHCGCLDQEPGFSALSLMGLSRCPIGWDRIERGTGRTLVPEGILGSSPGKQGMDLMVSDKGQYKLQRKKENKPRDILKGWTIYL